MAGKTGQLSIRCGYRTVNYGLLPITEKLLSDAHLSEFMRLEAPSLIKKTDVKKVTPAHTHSTKLGAGNKKHD